MNDSFNYARTDRGNPDIKFPPQTGKAVAYSKDGKITEWIALPTTGIKVLGCDNGDLVWIDTENCS